ISQKTITLRRSHRSTRTPETRLDRRLPIPISAVTNPIFATEPVVSSTSKGIRIRAAESPSASKVCPAQKMLKLLLPQSPEPFGLGLSVSADSNSLATIPPTHNVPSLFRWTPPRLLEAFLSRLRRTDR